jgi:hypothetical protein
MASQHFNILLSQLKTQGLEVQIAWAVGEEEAEVNMDHVAFRVEQDISIVTVFDLEQVAEQTVASHGAHEVLLGQLVASDVFKGNVGVLAFAELHSGLF